MSKEKSYPRYKLVGLFLGIIAFITILLIPSFGDLPRIGQKVLAIVALMVIWWVTEALPIGITALLPLVLCPLLGIAGKKVTDLGINIYTSYADPCAMMCIGIFIFSACIVKWGLHRRIALGVVKVIGGKPKFIILGYMLATAVVSMWISNLTATAMMLPLAIALLTQLNFSKDSNFSKALILSIPYGAGVGGMATLVGAGANVTGVGLMQDLSGQVVGFLEWMKIGIPFCIIMLPLTWFVLCKMFKVDKVQIENIDIIGEEIKALGPMNRGEKMTAVIFVLAILTFMTRQYTIGKLFPLVTDETVAIILGLVLFLIPIDLKKGEFLMDIKTAIEGVSWNTYLLLGGALCMGQLITKTGIADWVASHLGFLSGMPIFVLMLALGTICTFITEFSSNTVVVAAFLPMLYGMAVNMGYNPLMVMFVATFAAGCAWVTPAATPPNAFTFGTGYIEMKDMVKPGLVMKVISIVVVPLIMYFIAAPLSNLF